MSCRLLLNTEGNAETDVTFRRNRASARGNPSRAVAAVTQIMVAGGEGGIRTHGRLAPTPVFKTGALNHSATSPDRLSWRKGNTLCKFCAERAFRLRKASKFQCAIYHQKRAAFGG